MPLDLPCSVVGDGPPLVILHGLFGSGRNWSRIAKHLAGQGWRVLTPDMRNHGTAPWHDAMDYPGMADDLRSLLLRDVGSEPAVVVGHSMGGKAAMWLALEDPARVRALVPVDVAPVSYPPGRSIETCAHAMEAVPLDQVTRRADADASMAEAIPDGSMRAFLLQNLELPGPDGGATRWRMNLRVLLDSLPTLTGWPIPRAGSRYDGPTLVLYGGTSDYVRTEYQEAFPPLFPNARFEAIPGAGHWVHVENPYATLAALDGFLATV
ncbi:alpha/beta fold hydrolase [Roseospira navarrensis]|uniref:Alpha/beta fold hydrolase n=1 Tax=Roseospira navarrensis TaxID=140058 RepID=A0A7X1ZJ38_9PROT|nr:alpha/beta fold hydrolase [Roseospira navarrensis]MQX38357.1 alpha/beta fold hydrolase [Roseospira navarrensis]